VKSWWSLGRVRGVPVRLHWSALLGAVFFSGLRFAPGAWLGFVVVILVHELGHAFVVKATRQRVHGVDIHGFGGECHWSGNATPLQKSLIAWGGVAAQLVLFAVAMVVKLAIAPALAPTLLGFFLADFFYALTWSSLMLAALNLLPIPPLDGAQAWKLPGLLRDAWRRRSVRRAERIADRVDFGAPAFREAPRYREAERPRPAPEPVRVRVVDEPPKRPAPAAGAPSNDLEALFRKIAKDARDARR